MGDRFQSLVATNVSAADAALTEGLLRAWLLENRVIASEVRDNALGADGLGHAPGQSYASAVDAPVASLLTLVTNGVQFETGRVVAINPQSELNWVCAACGAPGESPEPLLEAISAWHEGAEGAYVNCPACGHANSVRSSLAAPDAACGHVVVTFWNWPPLSAAFVTQAAAKIGSPLVLVQGKI